MTGRSDWRTPPELFNVLDKGGVYQGISFEGFHFEIDLCATKENTKCDAYYEDYLAAKFVDFDSAFCNPPYSNPKPFVEKCWEDSKKAKIVMLVKCDPSTKWWAVFFNYDKGIGKDGCKVIYLPKRIKFDPPIGLEIKSSTASFPSAIIVMDRRNA